MAIPSAPSLPLSSSDADDDHHKFRLSFFVRVLGDKVGRDYLHRRFHHVWQFLRGDFTVSELAKGVFLFTFSVESDYDQVLRRGPWWIPNRFLVFSTWSPDFRPSNETVTSAQVWIRIYELPVEHYSRLESVAALIGKFVKPHPVTAKRGKLVYAKLCVEVDLTRPLVTQIKIRDTLFDVIYEGNGMESKLCSQRFTATAEPEQEQEQEQDQEHISGPVIVEEEDEWVHVGWNRNAKSTHEEIFPESELGGSRYRVLQLEDPIAETEETEEHDRKCKSPMIISDFYKKVGAGTSKLSVSAKSFEPQASAKSCRGDQEIADEFFINVTIGATKEEDIKVFPSTVSVETGPTVYRVNGTDCLTMEASLETGPAGNRHTMTFSQDNLMSSVCERNRKAAGPVMVGKVVKILCWSYRRGVDGKFVRAMKRLVEKHRPSVVMLLQVGIGGAEADRVARDMGFVSRSDLVEAGVWVMWREEEVQVGVAPSDSDNVTVAAHTCIGPRSTR